MPAPDLFEAAADRDLVNAPLAERMRPRSLDNVVGQEQLQVLAFQTGLASEMGAGFPDS